MEQYFDINHVNIFAGGILLTLSIVLFMIPIPMTERWHKFRKGRTTLAAAYIVLSILMIVNGLTGGERTESSGMITLIIAFFQALLYTKICVLFVKPYLEGGWYYRRLLVVATVYSLALAASHFVAMVVFEWMFAVGIVLYTGLLLYCSVVFSRNYKEAVRRMEYVYEEDMEYRLRWVRRCFYSALSVGVMVWFMAVWHEVEALNKAGIAVYTLYYLFMVGHFMRYVNNCGFIIKSASAEDGVVSASVAAEMHDFDGSTDDVLLEVRLAEWVRKHRYRNSDKTVDEIVNELDTSRRQLNDYMVRTYGTNFRTWRNRLRIDEAKKLLEEGDIAVAEIYNAVGYSDRSNFHRQFTSAVGMTPLQYRKHFTSVPTR